MIYKNREQATLMLWDTNEKKRNVNNIISFNLKKEYTANIGDTISCDKGGMQSSNYEITKIIEQRESSICGYNYITAETKWYKL